MAQHQNVGENALSTILLLIKNKFVAKVFKTGSTSEYKVLTDNDLTDTLKANYDAAYSHSQANHAPDNAQENVIEKIKVNGTEIQIESKSIDIPVPLISTDISTDKNMNTKAASAKAVYDYVASAIPGVSGGLSFKILTTGEYNASTGVPTLAGDSRYIYLVPITGCSGNAYKEFIYVNNSYECIGTTECDLSGYMKTTDLVEFTTDEINAIWTSVMSS
jgi:hypothetical protein